MTENEPEAAVETLPDPEVTAATGSHMTETSQLGRNWQGWLIVGGAVGAGLWGLVAAIGSDWGFWAWQSGMTGVHWSALLAGIALLTGLLFTWRARKATTPQPRIARWLAMVIALAYLGWLGTFWFAQQSAPAIHDISTDLADPPQYRVLALRPDNLDSVPGDGDAAMSGMNPQQRWALLHQQYYGDIRSVRIAQPVAEVMAKAERLATARNWEISEFAPDEGRLEAVNEAGLFGFHSDIALRVRATETADGSIVDMRSVSRELQNDRGTNAKLVRAFLADLSGTVTAAN